MESQEYVFGRDTKYDIKYYNMLSNQNILEKTEVITKLQTMIDSDQKLIDDNGPMMDKCCIGGYKWSDAMKNITEYHKVFIQNIKNNKFP
jgi:hypothetical protein